MSTDPLSRPNSPWPPPSDLADFAQIDRFRTGSHAAGLTIWLVRTDGTEHFVGTFLNPDLARLAVLGMNARLARLWETYHRQQGEEW